MLPAAAGGCEAESQPSESDLFVLLASAGRTATVSSSVFPHLCETGPRPLRHSEIRVLRYLPTNLTLPEIARELHVSHNTVKTHTRNLYTQLGLLAPAAHRR